jgi:hypothetical protein
MLFHLSPVYHGTATLLLFQINDLKVKLDGNCMHFEVLSRGLVPGGNGS